MPKYLFVLLIFFALSSFTVQFYTQQPLSMQLIGTWEVREITTKTWNKEGQLEKEDISYPSTSLQWTFTKSRLRYADGTTTSYVVDSKNKRLLLSPSKHTVKLEPSKLNEKYIDWKVSKLEGGKKVEQTYGLLKLY